MASCPPPPPACMPVLSAHPLAHWCRPPPPHTHTRACSVMNVIKVLAKVEEANQLGRQLPPEAFYNELIRWV